MRITVREMVLFALLGALMFCSKILTEALPNVHLLAMLTIAYTVVFRVKALYPIYTFVLLSGLFYGFGLWWVPYLYLWTILWAVVMLLPRHMPAKAAVPVYMITACLHGLCYGTLYAPFQALAFGLSFQGMIAWILAGLPWDVAHGIGNLCAATLTVPVITALRRATTMNDHSN